MSVVLLLLWLRSYGRTTCFYSMSSTGLTRREIEWKAVGVAWSSGRFAFGSKSGLVDGHPGLHGWDEAGTRLPDFPGETAGWIPAALIGAVATVPLVFRLKVGRSSR